MSTLTSCVRLNEENNELYIFMKEHVRSCLHYATTKSRNSFELSQLHEVEPVEINVIDDKNELKTFPEKHLFEEPIGNESEQIDSADSDVLNVSENYHHFEQAGLGLSNREWVLLNIAVKKLAETHNLSNAHFWGKIFGIFKWYYVVAAEMDIEEEHSETAPNIDNDETNKDVSETKENSLPKSKWKPPVPVPSEPNGTGLNEKVYFVCNVLGEDWVRLPSVTPQQIVCARSICRLFTGHLDAPVVSCPRFPGNEANYLRAQIARISASTRISPIGYYQLGEGGEEEEQLEEDLNDEDQLKCSRNPDYEAPSLEQLIDTRMVYWVHHEPYILPQGRTTWWNPFAKDASEEEEEDESEISGTISDKELAKPERGPPLLTQLSSDIPIQGHPAWSTRCSSQLVKEHAIAVVSSNLWPGAHAIAWDKECENIYVGWGIKNRAPGFQPYQLPPPQPQYVETAEDFEATDPTPEEEAAYKKSKEKPEEVELSGEMAEDEEEGEPTEE